MKFFEKSRNAGEELPITETSRPNGDVMKNYRNLKVWQRSHALLLKIYTLSQAFPACERYGLTAQLRKSALSIGSNLAEGCGRYSQAEYRRFVEIAAGSASELDYQLLVAADLGYLETDDHEQLHTELSEIRKMLGGLHRHLSP